MSKKCFCNKNKFFNYTKNTELIDLKIETVNIPIKSYEDYPILFITSENFY